MRLSLKGYTLVEVSVALLLSSIVLLFINFSIPFIKRAYTVFEDSVHNKTDFSEALYFTAFNFHSCDNIRLNNDSIFFVTGKKVTAKMHFSNNQIVLWKDGKTDSLNVQQLSYEVFFQNDFVELRLMKNNAIQFYYHKDYTPYQRLQR